MTWTATERKDHGEIQITTDIADEDGRIFSTLYAFVGDQAAIEQMRARARLIVQAEAMLERLKDTTDTLLALCGQVSNPDDEGGWSDSEAYEAYIMARAIIKETGGEDD